MRIPLDYYRILSIPIQATPRQLEQAYSDRLVQQPRREYNEQAIQARQELIQQAYQVLSDPEQRANYDAQFLLNMQPVAIEVLETDQTSEIARDKDLVVEESLADVPVANPTIEISQTQMVGALLILHELGEYELVLTLGIDYYNSDEFSQLQEQQSAELNIATQENIILALALAYLELGREQWHRHQYETAALSSQLGIDLLNQENLFPQVREELEVDLDKLRPYRVLQLISQNPPNSAPRAKGFQLLQEMLLQRQGIEGKGRDRSGLSFDRFLCFIQQLRTYLTSVEQQKLFDNNTQNDSAIASYLAVYALLARGFCGKQPELILRAQRKLDRLSEKQDVTWEQAVCALLLGHTEKAISKLHQSQDTSKLNQILRYSPGNADLLPGICFYSEQWLHEEVVSQFVDLVETKLTLKQYFADREVQAYLEELSPATVSAKAQTPSRPSTVKSTSSNNDLAVTGMAILSGWRNLFSKKKTASAQATSTNQMVQTAPELVGARVASQTSTTATGENSRRDRVTTHIQTRTKPKSKANRSTVRTKRKPSAKKSVKAKQSVKASPKPLSLPLQPQTRAVPPSVMQKAQGQVKKRRVVVKKKGSTATLWKGWLFIFSLIFGVGSLGFIVTKLFLNPTQKTAEAQLAIAISQPAIELPPVKTKPVVAKPKLTFTEQSQQVIEKWLASKSAAFGKEHQIDRLNNILAEPLLTTRRDLATAYQAGNLHREYEHQIKMRSAKINPNNSNQATVEAEVKEVAQHYQSGQLVTAQSYNDNFLVRYQLVRQGDKWLIKNMKVLETL